LYLSNARTLNDMINSDYGALANESLPGQTNRLQAAEEDLNRDGRLAEEIDARVLSDQELKQIIDQAKLLPTETANPLDKLKGLRGTFLSLLKDHATDGNAKLLRRINALACMVEFQRRQRNGANFLQVCRSFL
jgi:hypothetical protein